MDGLSRQRGQCRLHIHRIFLPGQAILEPAKPEQVTTGAAGCWQGKPRLGQAAREQFRYHGARHPPAAVFVKHRPSMTMAPGIEQQITRPGVMPSDPTQPVESGDVADTT